MKRPATKVEFEKAGDKDKKEATLTSEKVVEPKSVAHPVIFKRPASKQVPGPKPTKRNVEEKVEVRKKPAAQKETIGLKDEHHDTSKLFSEGCVGSFKEGGEEETLLTTDPPLDPPEAARKAASTLVKKRDTTPMQQPATTMLKKPKATQKPGAKSAHLLKEEEKTNGWLLLTFERSKTATTNPGAIYYCYFKQGVGSFYSLTQAKGHGYEP